MSKSYNQSHIDDAWQLYDEKGEDALDEIKAMLSEEELLQFLDELDELEKEEELWEKEQLNEMARSFSEPQELSIDTSKPLKAISVFAGQIETSSRSSLKCNVVNGHELKYRLSIKDSQGNDLIPIFDSAVIVSGQGLNGNNSINGQRLLWEETLMAACEAAEMALIDFSENISKSVVDYNFRIEEIDCTANLARTILSVAVHPCKKGRGWETKSSCPDSKRVEAALQRI